MRSSAQKLFLLILTAITLASAGYIGRHGMSSSEYQAEFDKYVNQQGMRLADVSGYNRNGRATYTAIFTDDTSGPAWVARHGLSEDGYQAAFDEYKEQGYRPHRISVFSINGVPYFACIFHKTSAPWVARHGLTPQDYQAEFDAWTKEGYRPIEVCGYTRKGATRYAAVWEKSSGPAWVARHGLSSDAYQREFDAQYQNGFKPIRVSGYEVDGQARYAAIWIKTSEGVYARHGLTEQNYQAEFDNGWHQGMTLKHVNGYWVGGQVRFAALWSSGVLSGANAAFIDEKVKAYMTKHNIPGLSIAVMKDERLVWAKGYGYADKGKGDLVSPASMFRIASVTKPITAAAILKLTETTNLKLSDKVFGPNGILGDICKKSGDCIDETDLEKITVQHCLEHTTGWTWDSVWEEYDLNNEELIKHTAKNYDQPNTPGSVFTYVNFNYFLLGRIIEKESGQSYQNYVKNAILSKCGITDTYIGADSAAGKGPNEVTYYPGHGGDPYELRLSRMDASGGWVSRPISMLKFAACIDKLNGRPDVLRPATIDVMRTVSTGKGANGYAKGLVVDGNRWLHNGCMSGTLSVLVHFANGISIAMAINTRPSGDVCTWDGMYPLADAIQSASISWPSHDLF